MILKKHKKLTRLAPSHMVNDWTYWSKAHHLNWTKAKNMARRIYPQYYTWSIFAIAQLQNIMNMWICMYIWSVVRNEGFPASCFQPWRCNMYGTFKSQLPKIIPYIMIQKIPNSHTHKQVVDKTPNTYYCISLKPDLYDVFFINWI